MIELGIIVFGILAILHFLFEEIVSPALRTERQFKLFALRDQLRRLKCKQGADLDTTAYHELQGCLNIMIAHLPSFTLTSLVGAKRAMEKDPDIQRRTALRAQILDKCKVPEVKRIWKQSLEIGVETIAINAGGWAFYVLPWITLRNWMRYAAKTLRGLVVLPEPELEKLIPGGAALAVANR